MPKYLVHAYAVVRVEVPVDAETVREAVELSTDRITPVDIKHGDFSEFTEYYIVDLLDENYQRVEESSVYCEWESPSNLINSHTMKEVL